MSSQTISPGITKGSVRAFHSSVIRAIDPARKARYDDLFAVYKTLHPSLRDTFAALARFR